MARRCATCKGSVPPRIDNIAFPFCSERCRLIDLGRWLGEEYRVPQEEGPGGQSESESGSEPPDGEPPPPAKH